MRAVPALRGGTLLARPLVEAGEERADLTLALPQPLRVGRRGGPYLARQVRLGRWHADVGRPKLVEPGVDARPPRLRVALDALLKQDGRDKVYGPT